MKQSRTPYMLLGGKIKIISRVEPFLFGKLDLIFGEILGVLQLTLYTTSCSNRLQLNYTSSGSGGIFLKKATMCVVELKSENIEMRVM